MRTFSLTDWLTFPKATVVVATLVGFMNGVWYLLGKPPDRVPHWASPSVLFCDLIVVTIGIVLTFRYRARQYRLLVLVYAMLLANLLAVIRILTLHR